MSYADNRTGRHPASGGWLRALTARLLLLVIGSALGLLAAEVCLRVAGVSFASVGRMDPLRGWALEPGASAIKLSEGSTEHVINSDGLRDRERSREKTAGTLRIAVLGDSFTYGSGVERDETYVALLERELDGCAALDGERPETVNFGVWGYGTAQELITYREHARHYDPDLVLLGIFTDNDVINNHRALSRDETAPYFTLDEGELVFDGSFRDSAPYRRRALVYTFLRFSRLAQLAKNVALTRAGAARVELPPIEEQILSETPPGLYRAPVDPDWVQAWAVTEALLGQLHREVREAGARFAVVTLSNPIQVYPDAEVRRRMLERIEAEDPFYPDARIRRLGLELGFPVVTLAPEMLARAEGGDVYYHGVDGPSLGRGHWNPGGHAFAARRIADDLCRSGLLD